MIFLEQLNTRYFFVALCVLNIENKLYMNIPKGTKNLLIINVLFFFGSVVASRYGVDLDRYLGLHFFLADDFNPIQLVSYLFMHANFEHLFFNMFAVWMFGSLLERVWGIKRFILFYMVCGIGAGVIQEIVQYIYYATTLVPAFTNADELFKLPFYINRMITIGASGAVYGILLAFGVLFPNQHMFIFPIPFPIKAKFFVIGYAAIEFFLGVASTGDGIAHFAHLGGMLIGYLLIQYWKKHAKNGL